MTDLHGRNGVFKPVEGVFNVVAPLPLEGIVVSAFVRMTLALKTRRCRLILVTFNVNVLFIAAHSVPEMSPVSSGAMKNG